MASHSGQFNFRPISGAGVPAGPVVGCGVAAGPFTRVEGADGPATGAGVCLQEKSQGLERS